MGQHTLDQIEFSTDRRDTLRFQSITKEVDRALRKLKSAPWRALLKELPHLHASIISECLERLQSDNKITVDGDRPITVFHYGKKKVRSSDYEWCRARVSSNQGARRAKAA